ncbi:helix-turn-helix domain-containing protein [Solimonas marina]|uniref:Helix-turn-helix domain-containing protein n=1 Tax=Solimonas marina TaxID=2714601 RepID=A0A969WC69_9GAMM|nr:helix-turn-helix domain-containing protein [Solimonas marina]NKF23509.1 helix-turn-helix domain-containing protein [Solimonas marina]
MQTFAVASVAPAGRLERWNEQLSALFSNLTAEPEEPTDFDGRLAWGRVESVMCATAWARSCRMHHGAESIADGSLLIKFQRSGRAHVSYRGQQSLLDPGDLVIFDTERPHELQLLGDAEMLAVTLPRAVLGERMRDLDRVAGQRLPGSDPAVQLCARYAESLWHLCGSRSGGEVSIGAASVLSGLLEFCVPDPQAHGAGRIGWEALQAYLQERLFDAELSIARISAELGVSARWLQKLFAQKGTTPARFILEARLTEAGRRLADSTYREQSITVIAYDLGFGDLTYFGRAFQARYGMTASEFRRRQSLN